MPATALAAQPEHARSATVTTWSPAFAKTASFEAYEKEFMNGGNLASGDVDGDGIVELVVGAGPGRSPDVRIFSTSGEWKKTFRAYPAWFSGGVRVAVGDVDGDGTDDIVTAPGPGIEPQVNVFRVDGSQIVPGGTWAYAKGFKAGVHVAVGDLDADGMDEIVTAPGPGGGPHIRVWDIASMQPSSTLRLTRDFFAYASTMTDGVTVAIVQTEKWGSAIITGVESWSAPLVRRFSADGSLLKEFYAYASSSRSGVSVTAWDYDGDGTDEIVTVPNGNMALDMRLYDLYGSEYKRALLMDPAYRGSVSLAPIPGALAAMPIAPVVAGRTDVEKAIEVDLKGQRLYAYEHGRVARSFLVSTGLSNHPTPEMEVTVTEKIPIKRYRWTYAPGSPDNYDLPNVKWNLRIMGPYHIHHAYWHNNFGHRMSHGCINVGQADAEWVYNWSSVGLPVSVTNGLANEKAAGVRISAKGVY